MSNKLIKESDEMREIKGSESLEEAIGKIGDKADEKFDKITDLEKAKTLLYLINKRAIKAAFKGDNVMFLTDDDKIFEIRCFDGRSLKKDNSSKDE